MADLSEQTFDEAGNDLTMSAAASSGDQFTNYGKQMLIIRNNSASNKSATVVAQDTSFEDNQYGNSVKEDQTRTISPEGTAIMGPFPRKAFNDGNGKTQVTYSDATDLEIAVVKQET